VQAVSRQKCGRPAPGRACPSRQGFGQASPAIQLAVHDEPLDPFHGDPTDPSANLGDPDGDEFDELSAEEREDLMEDLGELEVFQVLLAPRGIRGLVIDCQDCQEPHYFDWDLLRGNLRHLLDSGRPRVHEPAYDPDPDHYVSWEYARGYSDAVADLADNA
jgi:Family of unknown function (DUF5319)